MRKNHFLFDNNRLGFGHGCGFLLVLGLALGCSESGPATPPATGGSAQGGSSGTGGMAASGGVLATGGMMGATGGVASSGGTTSSGGVNAAGGATRGGGDSGAGGLSSSNGGQGSGGSTSSGGVIQTGGATRTGGNGGAGGVDAGAGSGGVMQTGGVSAKDAGAGIDAATGGTRPDSAASTGGSTSTGGAASCGVDPVTPNATAQARKALCYLYEIYGKKILSGQEENNDENAMTYINQNTGKSPAIRAFDVNNSLAPTQCVAHAKKGGLCMFGYHMGIANGDGYASSQTKTDINQVLTDGTAFNTTFKARLDKTAAMVQTAQDGGAVAIMRLFHEAGGKWFWWSMETGAQYVRLWKYAFNYLTVTKGLRNMLWLMPYNGSPDAAFYPGKEFVDIGGADVYAGDGKYDPQTAMYNSCVKVFGSTMPIALHECGPIPDPVQLQSSNTKWVLFNVWTSPFYQSPSNSVDHLKSVYTSDYVITLDEMPGF